MAGVVLPAGGRGAMVRPVERLFAQHAALTADAISHVTCLGPIRAAGPKCLIVKFRTVKEKLAAFQATSALRQHKVYLDDDITKAQQATRRQQEPSSVSGGGISMLAGRHGGVWIASIILQRVLLQLPRNSLLSAILVQSVASAGCRRTSLLQLQLSPPEGHAGITGHSLTGSATASSGCISVCAPVTRRWHVY